MDKDTIDLIIILAFVLIVGIIVALLIAYEMKLKYKSSLSEVDNDEEDINKIIARVIDQEFDKRFEEVGLLPPIDSGRGAGNTWYSRTTYYPSDNKKSSDRVKKLVEDMSGDNDG